MPIGYVLCGENEQACHRCMSCHAVAVAVTSMLAVGGVGRVGPARCQRAGRPRDDAMMIDDELVRQAGDSFS